MTDEKDFVLEAPFNSQNERVNSTGRKIDIEPERLLRPVCNLNFARKVMVSIGLSMRGKVFIHFFDEGERLNGARYRELLSEVMLPACWRLYPDGDFCWQHDGAKPHTAGETQRLLEQECEFIARHWPPYSPDATAPDYRAWADAERVVYAAGTPPSIEALQERIQGWWDELPLERVQSWMRELRPRWEKIVEQRGRQIQQFFNHI